MSIESHKFDCAGTLQTFYEDDNPVVADEGIKN
jgi:hypothetical protein